MNFAQQLRELHTKMGHNAAVDEKISADNIIEYLKFRQKMIFEEHTELGEAIEAQSAEGVIDAFVDLAVFAIGSLDLLLGSQADVETVWSYVHSANMQKEPGIKPARPNPFGFPDMIKPAGWREPDLRDVAGVKRLQALLNAASDKQAAA